MIDYHQALALDIPAVEHSYTAKDTMLYALGLGFGSDPVDPRQLRYVYEKGLEAFPTMAVVLGFISMRDIPLGIDYARMVHAEQSLQLHRPLPVAGSVLARTRVAEIVDRGDKGALIYLEREVTDKLSGDRLATAGMSVLCRADGGFGGPTSSARVLDAVPDRVADHVHEIPTVPQQALIYRLSGDVNPLHVDPEAATKAGFERPILHGLATFGLVARAIAAVALDGNAGRLRSLTGRFTSPVYPGETLRVELWRGDSGWAVRAIALGRDKPVFTHGHATAG